MTDSHDRRLDQLRQRLYKRGNQLPKDVRRLAGAVFNESDDRLSHEDCLAALPAYIDAEIDGVRIADKFPLVKQHLDACEDCAEQYAQLLELAVAEQSDRIPAASIPTPNLGFLLQPIALVDFVKQKTAEILAVIAPAEVRDLQTIANVFFERVDALGGKFVLQRNAAQALGLGVGQASQALTTLAITFAATQAIADAFTPAQIESHAKQNQLRAQIEKQARAAAETINVKPKLAKQIAEQFAQRVSSDPAMLRALIEQQRR